MAIRTWTALGSIASASLNQASLNAAVEVAALLDDVERCAEGGDVVTQIASLRISECSDTHEIVPAQTAADLYIYLDGIDNYSLSATGHIRKAATG